MDYHKQYCLLMLKARSEGRQKLGRDDSSYIYYEEHRILPEKMGGDDHPRNLVLLTGYEHYMAHYLLTKFAAVGADRQPCLGGLAAFTMDFTGKRALSGRQIGKVNEANSLATTLRLLEQSAKGEHQWQDREFVAANAVRSSIRGKEAAADGTLTFLQPEFIVANSARVQALADAGLLNLQTEEHRAATGLRMQREVTCPECGETGKAGGMYKWHFDNCGSLMLRIEQSAAARTEAQCPWCGAIGCNLPMQRWHFDNCLKRPSGCEQPASRDSALLLRLAEQARTQVTCPWCSKTGNKMPMHCWHFDKCLQHPENKGLTRKQIKEKLSSRKATEQTQVKQIQL